MQLFAASRGAASCCPKQAQLAHNSTSQAMPASAGVLVMSDSACTGLQGGQSTHGSDESEAAARSATDHSCSASTLPCKQLTNHQPLQLPDRNHLRKARTAHQGEPSHPPPSPPHLRISASRIW